MCARRTIVDSTHDMRLAGETLSYRLRRSNLRRTIGLKIDHEGLVVAAPLHSDVPDIERILIQHTAWIRQKTAEWHINARDWTRLEAGQSAWWLGRQVPLIVVDARAAIPRVLSIDEAEQLRGIPLGEGVRDPRAALTAWYKVQALPWFMRRIHTLMPTLTKKPARVALSQAKNRWGSCSQEGVIRLNWRLIQASPEEIDYVIAHECAHLLHMHHGPAFWETVAALYPQWKRASQTLHARDRLYRSL
jgi:predicted metal-dependent hydrolase